MNAPSAIKTPAAVVVTYEPDDEWPSRLRAVLNHCPRCIVVDNSITPAARTRVRDAVNASAGAELIANSENLGIGRALNQGCRVLHSAGYSWAITFDQDSTPQAGFAGALFATARASTRRVAVVGANWNDVGRPGHPSRHPCAAPPFGWFFRRRLAVQDLPDALCVITSGSHVSLAAWSQLGGFDENLFLDLVDTDFCLRARRMDWVIAVSAAARLDHQRGKKRPVRCLGGTFYPSFMPPSRLRSLCRNRLCLFRRHGRREPAWVAYELVYGVKFMADILFLEDQKFAKLAACLGGTWAGLTAPARQTGWPTATK